MVRDGLEAGEAASGDEGGGDAAEGGRVEDPERVVRADGREGGARAG